MVVIENDTATDNQIWEDFFKAGFYGVVPINVDMGKSHRLLDGHLLLYETPNQGDVPF